MQKPRRFMIFNSLSGDDDDLMAELNPNKITAPSPSQMLSMSIVSPLSPTQTAVSQLSIEKMKNTLYHIVMGPIDSDLDQITTIGKDIPRLLGRITVNDHINFNPSNDDTKNVITSSSTTTTLYPMVERKKRIGEFLIVLVREILLQTSPELEQSIGESLAQEVDLELHSTLTQFVVDAFGINCPVIQILRSMTQDGAAQPIVFMKMKAKEQLGLEYYDGKRWKINVAVDTKDYQQTTIVTHTRLEKIVGKNREGQNELICTFTWKIIFSFSRFIDQEKIIQSKNIQELSLTEYQKENNFLLNSLSLKFGEIEQFNESPNIARSESNPLSKEAWSKKISSLFDGLEEIEFSNSQSI
ncbi:hypothetical protein FDP41_011915 [Naegleria fowleri]|uniref:Ras guanine nucleotide exchange factor glfB-like C-terminal domain-containing protein n=1 Tax=Naegleria fowleri TaxID=5763 RepID=A0A6A5C6E4_NAEFO|nr:uncharacterized protein FDP41_011915 [Naegleria fowleri]KAF0982054.1 hypothetical protein FDP41_011915 [Naegleria fowleri]CAG4710105.1 unnamed protein product [Naegleria fowleri]